MSPSTVSPPVRHNPWYIMEADTVIRVDEYLFRVHSYFLRRESPWFRQILSHPSPPGRDVPGSSDEKPLVLKDVDSAAFARFLWVFYNPKHSIYDANIEEWCSILQLANEWTFDEVKSLAVRELEKLKITPVFKIHLYQKYNIDPNLLLHAYAELTARDEPLSLEEGTLLGMKTFIDIVRAREVSRGKRLDNGQPSPSPLTYVGSDLHSLVKEVFKLTVEISGASYGGPWSAPLLSDPQARLNTGGDVSHTVPPTPATNGQGQTPPVNGKHGAGDQNQGKNKKSK